MPSIKRKVHPDYRLTVLQYSSRWTPIWFDVYDLLGRDSTEVAKRRRTQLPKTSKNMLSRWSCFNCDQAIVAIHKGTGQVVGFFRYDADAARGAKRIYACGTWVAKDHRGVGLGVSMWLKALRLHAAARVEVSVVSPSGKALVYKVKDHAKGIRRWNIEDRSRADGL